jgi:hypothetical protein
VFIPVTGAGGPLHIEPVNPQAQYQYSKIRQPVSKKAIHLAVDRVRKGDRKTVLDCLCLNGSAHANTAMNEARVTCPMCLDILSLEKRGLPRERARQQIINPEEAGQ